MKKYDVFKVMVVVLGLFMIMFGLKDITVSDSLAETGTEVSGTIGSDTTWTVAGSPYILTNHVAVGLDATLTIEDH